MTFDLAAVPGVPETLLPDDLIGRLPPNNAPAPWAVTSSAVVWWSRAGKEAADALPDRLRHQAHPLAVVGGLVRYSETPVGTYDEVFGVVVYRIGRQVASTVAFMAVDSPTSLVGGRTNWSMPKTLATFEGDIDASMRARSSTPTSWAVSAHARRFGPPLPVVSRARVMQQFPDGTLRRCRLAARGRMRLARVEVGVEFSDGLAAWLRPGKHTGAVISPMRFSLGQPDLWLTTPKHPGSSQGLGG